MIFFSLNFYMIIIVGPEPQFLRENFWEIFFVHIEIIFPFFIPVSTFLLCRYEGFSLKFWIENEITIVYRGHRTWDRTWFFCCSSAPRTPKIQAGQTEELIKFWFRTGQIDRRNKHTVGLPWFLNCVRYWWTIQISALSVSSSLRSIRGSRVRVCPVELVLISFQSFSALSETKIWSTLLSVLPEF